MIYLLSVTTIFFGALSAYFIGKNIYLKMRIISQTDVVITQAKHICELERIIKNRDLFIGYLQGKDDEILASEFIGEKEK